MSSTWALKMSMLAALGVEPAGADVLPSGVERIAAVDDLAVGRDGERVLVTVPRSNTSRTPAESAVLAARLEHPELQELVSGEVEAGRAERGDHRAPAGPEVAPRQGPAGSFDPLHDPAGRIGVQGEVHARSRAALRCPAMRIRVSISSGRSSTAWPPAPGIRFCQVSATASAGSKAAAEADVLQPVALWGWLPNSQADSRRETGTPASASNSSR